MNKSEMRSKSKTDGTILQTKRELVVSNLNKIKLQEKAKRFVTKLDNSNKNDNSSLSKREMFCQGIRSFTPTNKGRNHNNEALIRFKTPKRNEVKNTELDNIEERLSKIFEYYCKLGERLSMNNLKFHNFYKMLIDSKLIDNRLNKTKAELIFTSECKNKQYINYNNFLNILVKIASFKYSNSSNTSAKDNLNKLLSIILPLFDQNVNQQDKLSQSFDSFDQTDENKLVISTEIDFDNETKLVIISCVLVLYDIYKVYFPEEISNSENDTLAKEGAERSYFIFLKCFNILPGIISKPSAFKIFKNELYYQIEIDDFFSEIIKSIEFRKSNKNFLGQFFNFFKFVRALTKISEISYLNIEISINKKLKLHEKLFLTLERMQASNGFQKLDLITSISYHKKFYSVVPKEFLEKLNKMLFEEKKQTEECVIGNNTSPSFFLEKSFSSFNKFMPEKYKISCQFSDYILYRFSKDLQTIYYFYCTESSSGNNRYLKSTSLIKLYREAGLVKQNTDSKEVFGVKMIDFEKMLSKLAYNPDKSGDNDLNSSFSSHSPSNSIKKGNNLKFSWKLDFNSLIYSIELITLILFPESHNLAESIDQIVENYLLPLISLKKVNPGINYQLEKETNDKMRKISMLIQKAFFQIFKYYLQGLSNYLCLDGFIRFCTDFQIFPNITSKNKIINLFKTICSSYREKELHENYYLDEVLFADLIIIIGLEVKYIDPQPSDDHKVLNLIEKIAKSGGCVKILKRNVANRLNGDFLDLLAPFKKAFPDYFYRKIDNKQGFYEILSGNNK